MTPYRQVTPGSQNELLESNCGLWNFSCMANTMSKKLTITSLSGLNLRSRENAKSAKDDTKDAGMKDDGKAASDAGTKTGSARNSSSFRLL